jgi:hypothetical protein
MIWSLLAQERRLTCLLRQHLHFLSTFAFYRNARRGLLLFQCLDWTRSNVRAYDVLLPPPSCVPYERCGTRRPMVNNLSRDYIPIFTFHCTGGTFYGQFSVIHVRKNFCIESDVNKIFERTLIASILTEYQCDSLTNPLRLKRSWLSGSKKKEFRTVLSFLDPPAIHQIGV